MLFVLIKYVIFVEMQNKDQKQQRWTETTTIDNIEKYYKTPINPSVASYLIINYLVCSLENYGSFVFGTW